MRTPAFFLVSSLTAVVWSSPAIAQVTDAERAAARALFREGDEMQRASKFADALDRFERAQQVFSAPTNMLRIAECEAALGRLVESAESYRALVRTPLPAGSPPAFQAAVDQGNAELSQVEPRVPKLVIQVQPPGVPGLQMQIDGQSVPAALVGEPMPLDPGTHKVLVFAPSYASSEQQVILKEHEVKTLSFALRPVAGVTYNAGGSDSGAVPPPPPPDAAPGAAATIPPPPPPIVEGPAATPPPRRSRTGLLLGGHVGWEIPTGSISLPGNASADASAVSSGGVAYALDGGLRFARQWYVGFTLEYAALGQGSGLGQLGTGVTADKSDTTLLGLLLALIVNPDRASFYGELGVAHRWYGFTQTNQDGSNTEEKLASDEFLLGAGLWLPIGRSLSLVPKATAGLGTFSSPGARVAGSTTSSSSQSHAFFMFGLAGFYNLDL